MWNPRLYILILCVALAGRASYRAALHDLNGDLSGWAGLIAFWIPLMGILWICISLLRDITTRWLRNRS